MYIFIIIFLQIYHMRRSSAAQITVRAGRMDEIVIESSQNCVTRGNVTVACWNIVYWKCHRRESEISYMSQSAVSLLVI